MEPVTKCNRLKLPDKKSRREDAMANIRKQVFQFKITLRDIKPAIWRRVQVESDITLRQLSCIIQTAMGWGGGHLHMFIIGGAEYSQPHEDCEGIKDDSKTVLGRLIATGIKSFTYEYDMGDGWKHSVALEAILPVEAGKTYPRCLAGKRACPPDDCGGPYGYEDFLKAIKDKKHPEHKEKLDWIGGFFDPECFDLEETNSVLASIDYDSAYEDFE